MEKKPYPSEMQERFIVRLPDGMRDRIADEAKSSGRSMNAEIVARLHQSFENNSTNGNLITLSMDELDALMETAINRALDRTR